LIAIETRSLHKQFQEIVALEPLDLEVKTGSITGFLGPNGAGKTTAIRLLSGLLRATSGEATVLEHRVPRDLYRIRRRVGVLLERPGFFPHLSARRNLALLATASEDEHASARIDPLLERVGLSDRSDDPVGQYSKGMRQRLGLAGALLHDPELLILDEPSSGLDPSGVIDIRSIIVEAQKEGRTVFLSSHALSEIERVCDHVCILAKGAVLYQGSLEALAARSAERVRIIVDDVEEAERIAREAGWVISVRSANSLVVEGVADVEVNKTLARRDVYARSVVSDRMDLEEIYLELTRGQERE